MGAADDDLVSTRTRPTPPPHVPGARPTVPTVRSTVPPARSTVPPARSTVPNVPSDRAVPTVPIAPAAPAGRRVIGDDRRVDLSSALDGAPTWVSGVLSAVQAALLSWLVVVVPAVAVFVLTSADPANEGVSWTRAVGIGTAVWLLAHGVPAAVGTTVIALVPLGLTALALFTCYASARRSGAPTRSSLAAGVATYVALVVALAAIVGADSRSLLRGGIGALLVGAIGLGAGLARRPGAAGLRGVARPVWSRLPSTLRVAVTGGVVGVGVLVAASTLLVTGWVVAGRLTIAQVAAGLSLDVVGGLVLGVVQLAWVPNLVVWGAAWLAGPGFAVGAGSHLAPDEVLVGPLPALPLLGALPAPGFTGGWLIWAPVVVVAAGGVAGGYVARRLVHTRWWQPAAASVVLGAVGGALVAALVTVASGGIGPGRMASVGAQGAVVGAWAALWLALGAAVVASVGSPVVRAGLRSAVGRGGSLGRGGRGEEPVGPPSDDD